jgi:hypothetical protein
MIRLLIASFPADRLDEARNCARREVGKYFLFDQRNECFQALRRLRPPKRMPPPEVIPEDHDPEVERRRLKTGGCCGAPVAE